MFRGLKYLKVPGSGSNRISYIEAGAFVNLTLTHLWLKNNPLETLINETDNPLVCDARMCWVKQSGLISWTRLCGKPECKNYPGVDWDNVTLDCLLTGRRFSRIIIDLSAILFLCCILNNYKRFFKRRNAMYLQGNILFKVVEVISERKVISPNSHPVNSLFFYFWFEHLLLLAS